MLRRGRLFLVGLAGIALAASQAGTTQAAPPSNAPGKVPTKAPVIEAAGALDGQWIVVLKQDATAQERRALMAVARGGGAREMSEYRLTLNGFAGRMSDKVVQRLRGHRAVEFIEADQSISAAATQTDPYWNLDRIDQRTLPLSGDYTYDETGAGVRAYVVDSGVRLDHQEFSGRMLPGYDFVDGDTDANDCAWTGDPETSGTGHGTHVAGSIGGTTFGVAKSVSIVPVRVLGCDGTGTGTDFLDAVEWVSVNKPAGTPAVANASLTFRAHVPAVERALERSISHGIPWVIAAGNDNLDACDQSAGSRVGRAIVVGATNSQDAEAGFSNHGRCVDLYAPGVQIASAFIHSAALGTGIHMQGTSMAAPHVAGAVALYLQANPTATPARVKGVLVNQSTKDVLTGLGAGSPNRLLYTGFLN